MEGVGKEAFTNLLSYGGVGLLAFFLLIAVIYLWRHNTKQQTTIKEALEARVADAFKAATALERSTAVLGQMAEVERQRLQEIKELTSLLREKLDKILSNQAEFMGRFDRMNKQ